MPVRIADHDLKAALIAPANVRQWRALRQILATFDRPGAALVRYLANRGRYPWAVTLRTPLGPRRVTLLDRHDLLTVNEVFCRRDYGSGPHRVVLDIGANVGVTALFFLTRSPTTRVFAFEPDPANVARLRENLQGLESRYSVVRAAVTATDRPTVRFVPGGRYGHVASEPGEGVDVPAIDVATAVRNVVREAGSIDLIKIDTEGTEAELVAAIPTGVPVQEIRYEGEGGHIVTIRRDAAPEHTRPLRAFRAAVVRQLPRPVQEVLHTARREACALALAGNRVACPVCRSTFRRFSTVPGGKKILCPRCLSLDRHRRVVLLLRRVTNLYTAPLRVLHIAPELGLRRELARLANLDYVTADLYAEGVDARIDVTAIPFPDESFDVLLCSHVLEHVHDDLRAMREFRRVLRSDGWALINVPTEPGRTETYEDPSITDPHERARVFGQEDHVRVYALLDFVERLRSAGFDVEVDPFSFTPEERARYVLEGDGGWDHSYLCRRAPE